MKLTVIIPTFNEAANIESILRAVRHAAPEANILVVDDNSPDGTGQLAEALGVSLGGIVVLHRKKKEGLGARLRCATLCTNCTLSSSTAV